MLAELVSGQWPFGDPESRVNALRRVIEDVPPTPLSEGLSAEHAGCCRVSLKQLRKLLKGDLSAIVSKGARSRRGSAVPLSGRIACGPECFANGLPVSARPQTRLYRAAKFVRRNPWNVALAGLFVLGMTARSCSPNTRQSSPAANAVRAQHISVFLEDLLGSPNPNWHNTLRTKAKDITITEVLGELRSRLGTELAASRMLRLNSGEPSAGCTAPSGITNRSARN